MSKYAIAYDECGTEVALLCPDAMDAAAFQERYPEYRFRYWEEHPRNTGDAHYHSMQSAYERESEYDDFNDLAYED